MDLGGIIIMATTDRRNKLIGGSSLSYLIEKNRIHQRYLVEAAVTYCEV